MSLEIFSGMPSTTRLTCVRNDKIRDDVISKKRSD